MTNLSIFIGIIFTSFSVELPSLQLTVTKRKKLLEIVHDLASQLDMEIYVVGGFVRDLFLYRSDEDIDIVIEIYKPVMDDLPVDR